jgi:hypothetical protein
VTPRASAAPSGTPARVVLLAAVLASVPGGIPALAQRPADRGVVAIPPVYPATPAGFLRLPDTRSAPVPGPAAPVIAVPGTVAVVLTPLGASPATAPSVVPVPPGRPVWTPSRLEPVTGLDGQGRITAILEHTPGRFER